MKRPINQLAIVSIALLPVACSPQPDSEPETSSFDVVFVRYVENGGDLFLLDPSNNDVRQLSATPASEEFPVWSPDGSKIAFLTVQDDKVSLRVMDSNDDSIAFLDPDVSNPVSWSGDSKSLVTTVDEGESRGLWTISLADGSRSTVPTGAPGDAYATWSPAANRLAFESTRDGNPEIYVAGVDGSDVVRLTDNDQLDEWPQWSNDGQFIAFASGVEGEKDLWVMRADGTEKRQLTDKVLFGDAYPSWSPDDKSIVITVQVAPDTTMLALVNVASGDYKELVNGAAASWRGAR